MDDADRAMAYQEVHEQDMLNRVRKAAREIPPGEPGDCRICGEFSKRLVKDACAPCRDLHNLG